MRRVLVPALLAVVAVATALVASFVLLGYAMPRSDPVGKLNPNISVAHGPPAARALVRHSGVRSHPPRRIRAGESDLPDD